MSFNINSTMPPALVPGGGLPKGIEFFDDFITAGFLANTAGRAGKFDETADSGEWKVTVIDGGTDNAETITIDDGATADYPGGWLKILCNDADNDAVECQLNGESFQISTTSKIIFEVRMKVNDVSETDWLFGLCTTDTDVLGGCNDSIAFRCLDSTGDIDAVTEDDTNETVTDTGSDLADDTPVVLRIEIDGVSEARFYVNGVLKATHQTNLPDTGTYLTPTMCIRNDGAVAQKMWVDYIHVFQNRVF